ncbi:hypothetical protein H7K24_19330 [Mycobacterium fragae]|jgi:hypothetical protein|uniref:Uncharacterized protein n=1 Tax=Mycobacterium fragae TaxID=1260918 RepID=A0A1X1USC0_9MYCO|nr:hypothetical protein [Mycobacterium fragae]MCV7402293.1 hypothetical protein [Mycobacterium fragae]ORV59677.1 hypothetical protein AWC06_16275 [Mycobacterium fragae]
MSFKVSNFCGCEAIRTDFSKGYREPDCVAVRDCDVEQMLIGGESFDGRRPIPCVADIEVAGSALPGDINVGRGATVGLKWSEHGFAATSEMLFGQCP